MKRGAGHRGAVRKRVGFLVLLASGLAAATGRSGLAAPVIIDNVDAGFTVLSQTWSTFDSSGQWGADYRYKSTSDSPPGEVEWRPDLPDTDDYEVAVWYRSTGSSRPNNAHYTVHYNGGTADVFINQQINGSQWVVLGTYPFAAGTAGRVTLTSSAQNNKTIVADAVKFETPGPPAPEFRGFWADVFHEGFASTTQIDNMIARAVQGGYNAIVPEVLAFHDTSSPSHGAYWESNVVARSSVVTGGFDPLAYMVQQAHASGIEVHPWLVAFRVSSSWPPPGNAFLAAHPEWLMVPQGSMGSVVTVGGYYTFDPGSPEVQEYLVSIVQELVTDYEIDGIHWDYIRYTQTDAGYPADTGYAKSSLQRFKDITGYVGTPSTSYGPWNDFRRRTITELIRRVRAEIPSIPNPRQPIRHTAALITWAPASTNFHSTNPYNLFCDWEYWASLGYLDATIPMSYFDEDGSYAQTYRDWVSNSVTWAYDRHTFIGPGIYLNSFANSLTQMQYARGAGAHGLCTYSYAVTSDTATPWTDWYPYIQSNMFSQAVPTPEMPWRDPATATEGTLFGQVTDSATGDPVDDATVQVGGLGPVQTDGNGYYVVTLIPAVTTGTSYGVTVSKTGYPAAAFTNAVVVAGDVARVDMILGEGGPDITAQPQPQQACLGDTAFFTVAATGQGTIGYQWRKNGADLTDGGDVSGATTATLQIDNVAVGDVASYSCYLTDDTGGQLSDAAQLTLQAATAVTEHPQPQSVLPGATVQFSAFGTGTGTVSYQWQRNDQDLSDGGGISGATSSTLEIANVQTFDAGAYRCVITADCGSVPTNPATLTVLHAPGDFDGDDDVDLEDFGRIQACLTGPSVPQNDPYCQDTKLDGDNDVDLDDVGIFQGCLTGANQPADWDCANP